jgi:transposase
MRRIREVLRLRYGVGLHQEQIARSCSIGQATVHRDLERAAVVGLKWPLLEELNDQQLDELLFPARPSRPAAPQPAGVDFQRVRQQLQTHKHLTLQLLWEEYREVHPDGYSYSRYCELYQLWSRNLDVVLRQEHPAGEKTFVDWAGDTVPIYDHRTGEAYRASIFVAVLGASNYTFAHTAPNQTLPSWIDRHVRAFEFFQGTTRLLVPDNPRAGVKRACRYEPQLTQTYREMAQH